MSTQVVFPGTVDESGERVLYDDPDRRAAALRKLAGRRVEEILRKPKSKRTLDQNAYIHKWPIPLLAEHFGDTIEGTKYDLAGECFGWVPGPVSGQLIPAKPSTSQWTVDEMTYFIDWVIPWAAQKHGVAIPLPNEADVETEF